MTFSRSNPGGWALYEVFTSAQANAIDINVSRALDGFAGGSYAPSAELLLTTNRFGADWFKAIPRGSAPGSPEEGDIWAASGSPRKRQIYTNGIWRTVMEELTTRVFMYPLACGKADESTNPDQPDWEWDSDYFWKANNANTMYITFDLNRFVPQGAELTLVRIRWDPAIAEGTQANRMRLELEHKTPTGGTTTEETIYADNNAASHWSTTGAISYVINSATDMWWIRIRDTITSVALELIEGIEITYRDTEYMRLP